MDRQDAYLHTHTDIKTWQHSLTAENIFAQLCKQASIYTSRFKTPIGLN